MTYKATKLGRLSLFVMVLFMVAVFAWPPSAVFAGQNDGAQYQGVHSKYTHSHGKGHLGTKIWTKNGLVIGTEETREGYQTWSWKGIPFAQPPVGELRWKAPQPPDDWTGARYSDDWEYAPGLQGPRKCPQSDMFGNISGDEDCLYLNVWRPATQQRNLPVYFWIHGGGNSIGMAQDPTYYGDKLACRGNMVVVTTNYRLGPFGWFLEESLQDPADPLSSSGNFGTMDIIQALKWVRENIAAFGGDPKNVTIAGESAGGWNVCSLIISPAAKGLFHRAISESGGFAVNSVNAGEESADAAIEKIIAKYGGYPAPGVTLEDYLRDRTPEEIFSVYGRIAGGMLSLDDFVGLFTDGLVIHADGQTALDNPNSYNQVPTILGTNKEEMKLFMFTAYGTMPDADYQAITLAASMDWQRTGVNEPATAMSAHKSQPNIYAYQFNYGAYNETGFNAWPLSAPHIFPPFAPVNWAIMIGAAHGLEMPFIFGNYLYLFGGDLIFTVDNKPGQDALSDDMVTYLSNFARTGKPKDPRGVHWLPWSNEDGGPKRIIFDADATESIIQMSNE